ncbi:MAG: hypothetical protein PWQ17_273 [Anaerophaga sp.]|nr:hypothetical protein [Anaerophaga sp.]MDN5292414.1 hypothetical protein [Anaerophaga sp.]
MASIEKHISDLLCLHDCVIVPGLGGFVANYKPAALIEERNLFQPPKKEIGFNRSLSHNDGLLTNHICKQEHLSWNESTERIHSFVDGFQTKINNGETFVFEGIGTFRKDALGNLQFTPNVHNKLLPDAYGLIEFHFEPLQYVALQQKREEPVRRLLRSRSPRYWATVAAMIAGLFLFTPELKMPEHQQIDTGNIISSVAEKSAIATQPATYAPKQLTNSDNSASDVSEKSDIASGRTDDQVKTPFHLIAASFKYEAPAQQTAEQMKKEGFPDAQILLSSNGRFRVALESFEKRDSAVERLFALRKNEKFENVWLLDDLSGK